MSRSNLRNAAIASFIAVGGLLAFGLLSAAGDGTGLYGEVTPPDAPTPDVCVYREGYTDPTTMSLWVPDYAGGTTYALVKVCVPSPAQGSEAPLDAEALPASYAALPHTFAGTEATEPYVPGTPHYRVWVQGHDDAPWLCACSSGASCRGPSGALPLGVTATPGDWMGEGCVPKPCVEWAGASSWPSKCPLPPSKP